MKNGVNKSKDKETKKCSNNNTALKMWSAYSGFELTKTEKKEFDTLVSLPNT